MSSSKPLQTYLQFGERESTSGTDTTIVFECGTADDRSELVDRARSYGGSFLQASITAAGFTARLAAVSVDLLILAHSHGKGLVPGRNVS